MRRQICKPLEVVPISVKVRVTRHAPQHPPESDVLLEATGIAKSFPGVRALDGVNITVRRGRLNALLGENGAGKSTLMNILAGVFPPDSGNGGAGRSAG